VPGNRGKGREKLVHIATAPNEMIVNIWKDVLAENGIHALLKSVDLIAYTSPMGLQYELQVLESEAIQAKEILAPFIDDTDSGSDSPPPDAG
jgi:hypothetical protein